MTFQPSADLAGGASYDDALQLFSLSQPWNNQYPPQPVSYLSYPPTAPYESLKYNYSGSYQPTVPEDPLPEPLPETDTGQQKRYAEILAELNELKERISSLQHEVNQANILLQTRYDKLEATLSGISDSLRLSTEELANSLSNSLSKQEDYIESHRAWTLIFKRAVEGRLRDVNSIKDRDTGDRAGGSEDSRAELQEG